MKALSFPKRHRLLSSRDYGRVFDNVVLKVPHRHFLILGAKNQLGHSRLGLIFSKKNLKLAVQRNRIKRISRETFRQHPDLPPLDLIILGRQGLASLSNTEVHGHLDYLWKKVARKYRQEIPS